MSSPNNENVIFIHSTSCRWKFRWTFVLCKTLLELYSKTVLQPPPEQLKLIGDLFWMLLCCKLQKCFMDCEPFFQLGAWVDNDRMIMFEKTYPLIQLKSSTQLGVEPTHSAKKNCFGRHRAPEIRLIIFKLQAHHLLHRAGLAQSLHYCLYLGLHTRKQDSIVFQLSTKNLRCRGADPHPIRFTLSCNQPPPTSNCAPQASVQWCRWNYLISKKALIWSWGHSSRAYPSQPEFVYRSMCTDFHIAVKRDGIYFCSIVCHMIYLPHVWWLKWTPTVRTQARALTSTHPHTHTHTHTHTFYIFGC